MDGIGCNLPLGSRGSLGSVAGAEWFGGTGAGLVLAIVVLCSTLYRRRFKVSGR
jgi:hypothetical protein